MDWRGLIARLPWLQAGRSDEPLLAGLRNRLLVMLLVPLSLLLGVSAWFDFRAASSAAILQDENMQRLAPLLADSVVAEGSKGSEPPIILLTPAIEDFIKERNGRALWGIATLDGRVIIGESWLSQPMPATTDPEFFSEEADGVVYRVMVQRASTRGGEFILLLADGSDPRQGWLRSMLLKVLLPNGLLILAVAFAVSWAVARALKPLTDITRAVQQRSPRDLSELDAASSPPEVRPLVESLNRLFVLVNAQSEAQRRFVADAAHQLRTPLAGLQAQVEAWVQSTKASSVNIYDEKANAALENTAQGAITLEASELLRLRDATRRTSQLATQLLALSRADAHSLGAQAWQSIDLSQLCADVLQQHLDHAMRLGIDLGMEAHSDAPLIARGHDWLLRELLSNLCDNAIRYTAALNKPPAAGEVPTPQPQALQVTLVAQRDGDHLLLQVRDNGPGISLEYRSKVLQRFFRPPGSFGDGNGLGLAIAQEIANLHGSELQLSDAYPHAAPGRRGLLISVRLPAAIA